jgi:HCOMODA/2-hydroxy-3-carboxy-muconic semialdehyde decarboxylase
MRRPVTPVADPSLVDDLFAASRILAEQGIVDAYGHVSVRHDRDPGRYLMSRSLAPALVTPDDIMEYDLDSNPLDARGRASFIERFIHGEIYKARPEVMAVVHNHSPSLIPFGVTTAPLRPLYHMSAFLGGGVPVFDIRSAAGEPTDMLVRTSALGRALAQMLGSRPVALMRGHGAVVVGPSLPVVVFRSVYTEWNAKLQAQALALGGPLTYLDPDEARLAEANVGGTVSRPWELWKRQALRGPMAPDPAVTAASQHPESVASAMATLDSFMSALNRRDEAAVNTALNFPHVRVASGRVTTWDAPGTYRIADFLGRAGDGWHESLWDERTAIHAGPDKVHLTVQFSRWRADGSLIGRYRSLWIVTRVDGQWGVQARSSFAA